MKVDRHSEPVAGCFAYRPTVPGAAGVCFDIFGSFFIVIILGQIVPITRRSRGVVRQPLLKERQAVLLLFSQLRVCLQDTRQTRYCIEI